jgi:long-chain acyl-CoA synthetase
MAQEKTTQPDIGAHDTFPKLLEFNARHRAARPAMREKDYGIWQSWSWAEVAEEARALACGLAALGCARGDKIAIIGDNRPRLYWSMVAAQTIGAIPVPMYQDSVADELHYVVDHAEARFAIAEDQEQIDKLLEIKDRCPKLETLIYDDSRGLRGYGEKFLNAYNSVVARGREYDDANPEFYESALAQGTGDDVSIMLYTSGTTGQPKGVVLTHRNIMVTAKNAAGQDGLDETDEVLAYLPMAWIGDHLLSFAQSYVTGFCVACPESGATVLNDIWELGPTYFFAPPRIYENLITTVMIRMEDAGWLKRKAFHYFMALARRVGSRIMEGNGVALFDRLLYRVGDLLIYGPLRNTLGMSRIRLAYTAGEAIGPDIFTFYRSIGLNLKQLYGMTEASVFVTMQPDGEIKDDTVGRPAPAVEIKIADNGEVLFKSPGIFREYYKNPEATAEAKTEDGWCHTGDAGFVDDDGHLKIVDRAKDVGKLDDGTLFAPKYIENKLKFFPHIKEAVAFGDGRDRVTAFINIDIEAVGDWAERHGIPYASYQELAANDRVRALIDEEVRRVNADLAAESRLAGSQVRRFLILHKELDADDGELTRTRKVRRLFVTEKYATLVEALFSDADHCNVEAEVTFEDGRTGTIKADLRIHDVAKTAAAAVAEAAE